MTHYSRAAWSQLYRGIMLFISWHMICCTENSCVNNTVISHTAKIKQHGGKLYETGKFSTVHCVMFKKSVFFKAFSELFFMLWYLRNQIFLMPFLSYFFETSPSLGSLSAISLGEFAAIRLFTFLPVDGLETKSPHCYKYTDTNQLLNSGPNVPQS